MSGHVAALWRYPVSSMGGEMLATAPVGADGIEGDRIWGLRDAASARIASPGREKHFVGVARGHARFTGGAGVAVSADGERWADPDDPAALHALSELFGFMPTLQPFAERGSGGFRPRYEHAPIHLLTSAALNTLRRELPGSVIDARRFRPNIVVAWPDEAEPIPETGWLGREIRIGELVLKGRAPCGRCGFITIEQEGLPLDIEILKTVVQRHGRNFGIYCDVLSPGEIRPGDAVTLGGLAP